jgi:hypothetical protein
MQIGKDAAAQTMPLDASVLDLPWRERNTSFRIATPLRTAGAPHRLLEDTAARDG